jgi:hypothetical protein
MYKLYKTKTHKKKKFMIITPAGRMIRFGAQEYNNFIYFNKHKTKEEAFKHKIAYIKRHYDREDWEDITTAGAFSKHLLWNKPTLKASIADMEKKFDIKIQYMKAPK